MGHGLLRLSGTLNSNDGGGYTHCGVLFKIALVSVLVLSGGLTVGYDDDMAVLDV